MEGLALAYRRYSRDYVEAEKEARKRNVGMWQGEFVKPWDWRKGKRLATNKPATSENCLIKGNISGSGKIYHIPGSKWYDKTKINKDKGERWVCSEAETREAGGRAPN